MLLGILGPALSSCLLLGSFLAQNPAVPQQPPAEIEQILKASGYIHKDEGGFISFKLRFTDTNRTHTVYVRKTLNDFLSLRAYEVYGLAYESSSPPSSEVITRAFEKRFSLGNVILEQPSEKQPLWRIRYRLDFHSGWSADKFKETGEIVAGTADSLEKELNPGQEDKL